MDSQKPRRGRSSHQPGHIPEGPEVYMYTKAVMLTLRDPVRRKEAVTPQGHISELHPVHTLPHIWEITESQQWFGDVKPLYEVNLEEAFAPHCSPGAPQLSCGQSTSLPHLFPTSESRLLGLQLWGIHSETPPLQEALPQIGEPLTRQPCLVKQTPQAHS